MLYKYDMKNSETNLVMDKTIEKGYFRFNFKPLFVLFFFFNFFYFMCCVSFWLHLEELMPGAFVACHCRCPGNIRQAIGDGLGQRAVGC